MPSEVLHRGDEQVETLDRVVEACCSHGDDDGIVGQVWTWGVFVAVVAGGEWVADDCHLVVAKQCALVAALGQPVAHSHKVDATAVIQVGLAPQGRAGQCAATGQQGALGALAQIAPALVGMVAHASAWPHVVHGPDDGLAQTDQSLDVTQREHALVGPAQQQGIGLTHPGVAAHIDAASGRVDLKQCVAASTIAQIDAQSFGQKRPVAAQSVACHSHMWVVAAPVDHEHAGICALLLQAVHQPQGGDGRPAQLVAAIDQDDSHLLDFRR